MRILGETSNFPQQAPHWSANFAPFVASPAAVDCHQHISWNGLWLVMICLWLWVNYQPSILVYIGYGWTITHSNYDIVMLVMMVYYLLSTFVIYGYDGWLWLWLWLLFIVMNPTKNYPLELLYYQLLWSTWLMSRLHVLQQKNQHTSRREIQNRRPRRRPVDPSAQVDPSGSTPWHTQWGTQWRRALKSRWCLPTPAMEKPQNLIPTWVIFR